MKLELTDTALELFDLLKSREVNRDSCIGVLLTLQTDDKFKPLIQWIQKHPRAKQYEILGQLDIFKKPKPVVSYSMQPRTIKKIAMF